MSTPVLFDADASRTKLGARRRANATVAEVIDASTADLFAEFADARAAGRTDLMTLIKDHAYALDPQLVDELDGFDYPAAA